MDLQEFHGFQGGKNMAGINGISTDSSTISNTGVSASKSTAQTTGSTANKAGSYGKTIGDVNLSEEGAKYYEQLKSKYSNMDFILVSSDQKATAQANAASYANSSKMVVLIDEEKVERMATDENFRNQYEGIISNAASGLSQLKTSIQNSGLSSSVKGYGMQVNDGGTASFFAVLKKSSADQKARIEKKREENKAEKKAEAKKEAKKKAAQKADEKADEKKAEESEKTDALYNDDTEDYDDDFIIISAGSIDELMQKLSDYEMAERSNNVQTESEKMLGQHIDFRM
jgi:hypothetical protein